jgi:hypothetical protein
MVAFNRFIVAAKSVIGKCMVCWLWLVVSLITLVAALFVVLVIWIAICAGLSSYNQSCFERFRASDDNCKISKLEFMYRDRPFVLDDQESLDFIAKAIKRVVRARLIGYRGTETFYARLRLTSGGSIDLSCWMMHEDFGGMDVRLINSAVYGDVLTYTDRFSEPPPKKLVDFVKSLRE